MGEKAFNLLHEPWLKIIWSDGKTDQISLLDTFQHAHEIKCIAGDIHTQDIAVLRLLLSILHSTFGKKSNGTYVEIMGCQGTPPGPGMIIDRWKTLWNTRKFPYETIYSYLLKYEEHFFLVHPERPFYQVAQLSFGTTYSNAKLNGELSESNNKIRLFSQRTGEEKNKLSYDEAARWLLHINGFDDTSSKPKGKNLGSPGVGWLGKLGLIYATGENLFETLMLNLVLLRDGENELWGVEKPVWELDIVRADERTPITVPNNQSELLTIQSRRLLLNFSEATITGYTLLGGDYFNPEDEVFVEQMTCWQKPSKSSKSTREFIPRRHQRDKQLWRDFSTLLSIGSGHKRPGIVDWLSRLQRERVLSKKMIRFSSTGISYADKDFFAEDIISDNIEFSMNLLSELGVAWSNRIIEEIETTDLLVSQLVYLAECLAKASGASSDVNLKTPTKEQAYFMLDIPFRRWLIQVDPESMEIDTACEEWWSIEKSIVRDLGRRLVEQSSPQSFVGKELKEKSVTRNYSTPECYNRFLLKTSSRKQLLGGKDS